MKRFHSSPGNGPGGKLHKDELYNTREIYRYPLDAK